MKNISRFAALAALTVFPVLQAEAANDVSTEGKVVWSQTAPILTHVNGEQISDKTDTSSRMIVASTLREDEDRATESASANIQRKKEKAAKRAAASTKTSETTKRTRSDDHAVEKPPEVAILSNVGGVLTPYGSIAVEPFAQYSRSSVNTFTFQGVQILPAFLIGQINAVRTSRDLATTGATLRAGVTNRLEVEVKVPFVVRQDAFTNVVPTTAGATVTRTSFGYGLGDVEVAAHYQINEGRNDWPFFIANARFKTDTGTSPYEVGYHADGSPKELATGSGFMAVEPSLTLIYPSDPAILFANFGYIYSFERDINRNVANNFVGHVEPGDNYTGSLGVGLAVNDRLSLTFGYEHDYVRPTTTQIGVLSLNSDALQVGSALTGLSFKVNDNTSVNLSLAAGVTRDAPDAQVTLRVPMTFRVFNP